VPDLKKQRLVKKRAKLVQTNDKTRERERRGGGARGKGKITWPSKKVRYFHRGFEGTGKVKKSNWTNKGGGERKIGALKKEKKKGLLGGGRTRGGKKRGKKESTVE